MSIFDHINLSTIKKIQLERPAVRVACCEWMVELLHGIRNIDVLQIGKLYDYGNFKLSPCKLYHDVPNCGWRIFKEETKIFHATDTQHLQGISAKGYDLYSIEANYDETAIWDIIREKEMRGEFSHERGSINSHLSEQQAVDFFISNKKETSQLIRLHE